MNEKAIGVGVSAFLLCVLFGLWPLALLWALNTVFALAVPFAWDTYAAALCLLVTAWGIQVRGDQ